ncbi:MAG: binding-protein-dependent transport system inner rane component [Acidimicrobiaceae bacterium]|nr:binding-protein-dependent transport system inner rane component [Acidimicrobiaceae bacterium]
MAKRSRMRRRVVREVGLNVSGAVIVGLLIFPVYWALCVALQNNPNFFIQTPDLFPIHLIWGNFRSALQNEGGDIVTSLIIALSVVVIGLVVAVPTAYGLKRFRVRYASTVVVAMLISQMVPAISLSISFYSLFRRLDLLNGYVGLILADSTYAVPLMVVLIRAYLVAIPIELFDSARVDGCGELRCLWSVVVPMAVPAIVTASLFGFLGAWGDFVFGLTLNSGSSVQPVTLGLYKYVGTYSTAWGPIMATVILAAIPAGIVISVAQKWVRGGLRAGALQG